MDPKKGVSIVMGVSLVIYRWEKSMEPSDAHLGIPHCPHSSDGSHPKDDQKEGWTIVIYEPIYY
jgi:hypothetical protein